MRLRNAFLAGLAAAALVGCSSAAAGPDSGLRAPVILGPSAPAASSARLAPSITPKVEAAVRPAAAHFYSVLSARKFTASWDLLAPSVKKQVPLGVWVGVHEACQNAAVGKPRAIKAVTVFGNAAIVTTVISGAPADGRVSEDVFNYANGRWTYSPRNIGIYLHGSVAADVAAAKAAGLCAGWESF